MEYGHRSLDKKVIKHVLSMKFNVSITIAKK